MNFSDWNSYVYFIVYGHNLHKEGSMNKIEGIDGETEDFWSRKSDRRFLIKQIGQKSLCLNGSVLLTIWSEEAGVVIPLGLKKKKKKPSK